jgi:D-glycero-D-manno-heptose 1,7-bisphosphate phosphatase
MNKAVFLDRDGTINVDKGYLYKIDDFEFLPGAMEGLKLLQDAGYLLVVITNQSGIGRGYYTEEDYKILMDWMNAELQKHGINISSSYFCPHLPDAQIDRYRQNCDCRKPKTRLFRLAVKELNIDLSKSWTIGDRIRDCSLCERTECHGYLVEHTENQSVIEEVKAGIYRNIRYSNNLYSAAKQIIR